MGKVIVCGAGRATEPGSGLPSGYSELVYIQSSGTQYIDTEYTPVSDNLRIEATFAITEIQAWKALFGSEDTGSGPWSLTILENHLSELIFYTGTSSQLGNIPVTAGTVYNLVAQNNNGTLTYSCGSASGTAAASGSIGKAKPIYLFTLHSANTDSILGQASCMKLYGFKIYDNGKLVRDFVPCISDAKGIGMYDLVGKKFYGNAGTGSFIGSEVA